jgi:hypothetical protein
MVLTKEDIRPIITKYILDNKGCGGLDNCIDEINEGAGYTEVQEAFPNTLEEEIDEAWLDMIKAGDSYIKEMFKEAMAKL